MTATDLAPGGCTARNSTSQQSHRAAPITQLWFSWSNPQHPALSLGSPPSSGPTSTAFPFSPQPLCAQVPLPEPGQPQCPPYGLPCTPPSLLSTCHVSHGAQNPTPSTGAAWGCSGTWEALEGVVFLRAFLSTPL